MDSRNESTARALIRRHGWNTACYQILNPGFTLWFSDAGDAVVGYVESHRVRVVGGAPVCAESRLPAVLAEFERAAAAAGAGVVYFAAESRLAAIARAAGDRPTFLLGAQPLWRPHELSEWLEQHASLRAQLHRARNKGVRVREYAAAQVVAMRAKLERLRAEWLDTRGLPPLHFLVETDTFGAMADRRLWVAERHGEPIAFLLATPIPARAGWLVEHTVRGTAASNGTNELLLHAAACDLEDAALITLGLAPLSRRAPALPDPAPAHVRALLAWLRAHGRRFYDFEGLDAYKAKFRPSWWEPVYASLAPNTSMRRALLAITAAFGGRRLRTFVPAALLHALRHEAARLWR